MTPRENPVLIGHEDAERTILDGLAAGRLHHAWLITGPEGVGKATLAFRFARRMLAGGGNTLAMEASHPVFRRVAAGSHADLLTVEREWDEKKKRLKKNISADSAREIPNFLHLTPAEGGWRVVIVDGAEDLNAHSANALLKILEEPPSRAMLILVTSAPGRLLPTIRSRCRRLALGALSQAQVETVLEQQAPELDAAARHRLASLARGSPGRAVALSERGGLDVAAMVDEVLGSLPGFSLIRGYEMADGLRDEDSFELFFDLLRGGVAGAVQDTVRDRADPARQRLAGLRGTDGWVSIWQRLGEIQSETAQHNLDRRQAVMAALSLML